MTVIKYKKIFFITSAIVVLFSLFSIFFFGLNPSIEFTGGSLIEITYHPEQRPHISQIETAVNALPFGSTLIQPTGESGYIIRTKELNNEERAALINALSNNGELQMQEERYALIGPSIGNELRKKAWIAIALVLAAIILFVAFAFRRVSGTALSVVETRVRSWHYGIIAIVALAHDIIIPTGIFSFLGIKFVDAQIDVLFLTALLAILGYSVNDTIVVFDRVRENLRRNQELKIKKNFSEIVGESLKQTYVRSINTSFTTLLVIGALYFFGGEPTKNFALVLGIGVIVGTYSSLFLATPLLVAIDEWRTLRRKIPQEIT